MKFYVAGKGEINLTNGDFIAKGGEGSLYLKGRTIYKICEPNKSISEGKIKELSKLQKPNIIVPQNIILDSKHRQVGYTMKAVPQKSLVLGQMLTKSYRDRNNVSMETMQDLILQIREGIEYIHSKGVLQVDGNELNYMVSKNYDQVYFIDVNSYETKSYPAEAIMQSIRDWHVEQKNGRYIWTELSDWFSFAIISFHMFTGIHPYKGSHPRFSNAKTAMVDMMKTHTSVLNSETRFPKAAAYPFSLIPKNWMEWFTNVLENGKRIAPPQGFMDVIVFTPQVKTIVGSDNFEITEVFTFNDRILRYYSAKTLNKEIVILPDQILVNRKPIKKTHSVKIGFTPIKELPVAAYIENDLVHLIDLEKNKDIIFHGGGDDVMSSDGRLYVHSHNRIYEVMLFESGQQIQAAPRIVCDVVPNATKMFPGVAIQNLFDGYFVSVFPASNSCVQFRMKELNDYKIIDAKYERGVLMVVGVKDGRYDRFVFRLKSDWSNFEQMFLVQDINYIGLNFTVLDTGVCIFLNEEEEIEVFSNKVGSVSVKKIADKVIDGNIQLYNSAGKVLFTKDSILYQMSMK